MTAMYSLDPDNSLYLGAVVGLRTDGPDLVFGLSNGTMRHQTFETAQEATEQFALMNERLNAFYNKTDADRRIIVLPDGTAARAGDIDAIGIWPEQDKDHTYYSVRVERRYYNSNGRPSTIIVTFRCIYENTALAVQKCLVDAWRAGVDPVGVVRVEDRTGPNNTPLWRVSLR